MQADLFDESLVKKVEHLEKWLGRIQKELTLWKAVVQMREREKTREMKTVQLKRAIEQMEFFGT